MPRSTAAIDTTLLDLAARQDAVVAARQLTTMGISRSGRATRRERGMLHELFPRVYSVAVPPDGLSRRGWEMAAQLRARAPVFISHESAATRLEIWTRASDDAPIHVTCGGAASAWRPPNAPGPIVTHRSRDLDISNVWRDGEAWVATAARTCLDLGTTHRPLQITSMIREAVHNGQLRLYELQALLEARGKAPGTAVVRAAVDWYVRGSAGTRSRSEDELDRLIEVAGLPKPLVNVRNATGMPGVEADFVWRDPDVIVEIDGGHHWLPGAQEFDRVRDAQLRALGWVVLRFHYTEVWQRPWEVIAAIHRALGHCSVSSQDGTMHKSGGQARCAIRTG